MADDLTPEEAGEIRRIRAGNVPVRNVKIGTPVMIKVPGICRPRPPTHANSSEFANILDFAITNVTIERITARMALIKSTNVCGLAFVKARIS